MVSQDGNIILHGQKSVQKKRGLLKDPKIPAEDIGNLHQAE